MSDPPVGMKTWLLVGLFILSLPAVTPRIYASDEAQYFVYLRSLWFDHDVDFENDYRYFYDHGIAQSDGFRETFLERETENGRRINFATIGCALLWSPFYAIADAIVRVRGGGTEGQSPSGFGAPYIAAVAYGSALYGFLALMLAARVAGRWIGDSTWPALFVWVGTPLLFYMYVAPPMSHACSAFAVAAFLAAWLRVRQNWSARGLAGLGALAALMAMVREQDAFFVVGPLVDFGRAWIRSPRRADASGDTGAPGRIQLLVNAAIGTVVAAIAYLPQAMAYLALNGHLGPSRLVARKMTWTAPHFMGVLFSPAHGLFVWTPLALVAVAGLCGLIWRSSRAFSHADMRWIAGCMVLMVVVQAYVAGSVESWTVAGAFGQRRFIALSFILVFGLTGLWALAQHGVRRATTALLVILCLWWNLGLAVQFGAGLMDRQQLEPQRNAYFTFVVLPRELPGLAIRYLFERESFYKSRGQ